MCSVQSPKFVTMIWGLGNKRTSGDHWNYNIVEIGQNTEKSPGYKRKLVVYQTPVKDHQLTLVFKTLKKVGCRKGYRSIAELLYMDQRILNENKTRRKNLAMAWSDYKKGVLYGSAKLDNKLPQSIQNIRWTLSRVEFTTGGRSLAEAKI